MHTAAKDGNEYTMKGLVKLGADINIKDNDEVSETLIITSGWFSFPSTQEVPCMHCFCVKHDNNLDLGMHAGNR